MIGKECSYNYEERRQQNRVQPKQPTYMVSGANSGLIVNINMSGLAFDYIARRRSRIEKPELSILYLDDILCEKLAFKVVYDHDVPHGYDDTTMIIKRCGIRFEDLAHTSKKQLEHFLYRFTC